jgi:hypothetical protein
VNDDHDEAGISENGSTTTTDRGDAPEGWDPEAWAQFERDRAKGGGAAGPAMSAEIVAENAKRAYLKARKAWAEASTEERPKAKRAMDAAKATWDLAKNDHAREVRARTDPRAAAEEAEAEAEVAEIAAYGIEPAGEIDGAHLANRLVAFYRRYVNMTAHQAHLLALWTIHTHAIEAADFTPYIAVEAPTMRAGKTRTMEVASLLAREPKLYVKPSVAVVFRVVGTGSPTLLLDEYDAIFNGDSDYADLRAMLDAGYERSAVVPRIEEVKGERVVKEFPVFSAKMLAGIGRLPSTVADRSVPIRLRRKRRGEREPKRFRKRRVEPEARPLRQAAYWWAKRNVEALREAEPELPEALNDRQQDGAEALLAIADRLGPRWAKRARRALVEVVGGEEEPPEFDGFSGRQLLANVRAIFDALGAERLRSATLVALLNGDRMKWPADADGHDLADPEIRAALEDLNWQAYRHGQGLDTLGLAARLHDFGVKPRDIRVAEGARKGYRREWLEDAWARYL